jgi:hypothetical protein
LTQKISELDQATETLGAQLKAVTLEKQKCDKKLEEFILEIQSQKKTI